MSRPRIFIHEVGPRDGLQAETRFVPTGDKVAFIDSLGECGFARIEATSFTSPRAIPALADAAEVMRLVRRAPGTGYCALVPNRKGAERAIESGVDELNFVMSVSETHNLKNIRMTPEESFRIFHEVRDLAASAGVTVNVSLATAFFCPYEGMQPQAKVLGWAERYVHAGADRLTVCDTIGAANPTQVAEMTRAMLDAFPGAAYTLHFHDTRGMALANVIAAVQSGAQRFEATVGGLGGCPYAPGASGNACTEDLVHMLESSGFDTGVDLERLLTVARGLPALVGHDGAGHLAKAGLFRPRGA